MTAASHDLQHSDWNITNINLTSVDKMYSCCPETYQTVSIISDFPIDPFVGNDIKSQFHNDQCFIFLRFYILHDTCDKLDADYFVIFSSLMILLTIFWPTNSFLKFSVIISK